jgi:AraC-like DNA-binding protein
MDVPCYSARFIPPFAQVLSTYESFAPESLSKLRAIDPACRIPTTVANDLAIRQVATTGDADLGLKAARVMPLGRAGPLDYAIHSAPTVRQSVTVADRYIRAYSDVLNVRLDREDSRAMVRLEMRISAPRPILDFTMSAWYANHVRPPLAGARGIECWFAHPKPRSTTEYERSFEGASLRFEAPSYGFAFDREYLEAPLPCADAPLHALLCEHVELTMGQWAQQPTMSSRVRETASRELLDGDPTVFTVARQLRMSARTLGRRLGREGTTFSAILDSLRQDLAVRYVAHSDLGFADIAFRLGFSHVEAFYRAFRRWTGRTPLSYRRVRVGSGADWLSADATRSGSADAGETASR